MKAKRFLDIFREESSYKSFLLSILITGLSYGLYKGILDNYLADVVLMGEMDRGITEFFREIPGIALVFILAAFYMLSAESLYKIGALIMLMGMTMQALIPPSKVLVTLAICTYSLGEHIQIGMKSALSLQYSKHGNEGAALGIQGSANQIGLLAGYVLVIFAFSASSDITLFKGLFILAAALALLSLLFSLRMKGSSKPDENASRFYFRKKYIKYYMLEMFYGARKQVFITFGPYVLILFYKADAATVSTLFAVSAVACMLLSPVVGKIIDAAGYKAVMVADTLILVIVCFFYGFAHHLFSMQTAFIICCVNYVLDSVISMASMASNVYVQEISDNEEEVKATISTGVSINHVITIFIALFGGWIWQTLGIETLFIVSAILGLCNSAYAASIKTPKKTVQY